MHLASAGQRGPLQFTCLLMQVPLPAKKAAVQVLVTRAEHRCRAQAHLHTHVTMMVPTAML